MELFAERSKEEQAALVRWKALTEDILPGLARESGWPIHFDHCFKRICLDYAFEDVWYKHLAKPAEKHLQGTALRRALQCAEDLVHGGVSLLQERDAASLQVRGKRPKRTFVRRNATGTQGL